MSLFKVVFNFSRATEDRVQWTMGVDGNTPNNVVAASLGNQFATLWQADAELTAAMPINFDLEYVEMFGAEGGPAAAVGVLSAPEPMGLAGGPGPEEIAIRVSSHVDGVRGNYPAGGYYVGPLAVDAISARTPDPDLLAALRQFHVDFHEQLLLSGYQPVVISRYLNTLERPAPIGLEIVGYSTDNAWDTQRRRGSEPTQRTYQSA